MSGFWSDHIETIRHHLQMMRLAEEVHRLYLFTLDHPIPTQTPKERHNMPSDPISELNTISAYAQASAAWIAAASALIAQLEAASTSNPSPTDSDSPDVEAAIQNILTFQTANPVPAVPTAVAAPAAPAAPASPAPSTPPASS